jgi:hypothetical protein
MEKMKNLKAFITRLIFFLLTLFSIASEIFALIPYWNLQGSFQLGSYDIGPTNGIRNLQLLFTVFTVLVMAISQYLCLNEFSLQRILKSPLSLKENQAFMVYQIGLVVSILGTFSVNLATGLNDITFIICLSLSLMAVVSFAVFSFISDFVDHYIDRRMGFVYSSLAISGVLVYSVVRMTLTSYLFFSDGFLSLGVYVADIIVLGLNFFCYMAEGILLARNIPSLE